MNLQQGVLLGQHGNSALVWVSVCTPHETYGKSIHLWVFHVMFVIHIKHFMVRSQSQQEKLTSSFENSTLVDSLF